MRNSKKISGIDRLMNNSEFRKQSIEYFNTSLGSPDIKISQFPKYTKEEDLQNFIFKLEVFKKILKVHGSIIELGVLFGGGLMTWAKLSSIFEPLNHSRKIIGYDTFSGFPTVSKNDKINNEISKIHSISSAQKNDFCVDSFDDLLKSIRLYDSERCKGSIKKIELVKGDITKTIPKYLKTNPHLVISLLNLDLDLYKPTKFALKHLLPRMVRGSIICFDELNHPRWPGETIAVMEELGLNNIKLERFEFAPNQSYAVLK